MRIGGRRCTKEDSKADKGKGGAKRKSDTQASSHDDGGYGGKRQRGKGGGHGKGGGKGKGTGSNQKGKHVY